MKEISELMKRYMCTNFTNAIKRHYEFGRCENYGCKTNGIKLLPETFKSLKEMKAWYKEVDREGYDCMMADFKQWKVRFDSEQKAEIERWARIIGRYIKKNRKEFISLMKEIL